MSHLSIFFIAKNNNYRQILINELCKGGITNIKEFTDAINYILDEKINMFDIPEFNDKLYDDEEEFSSLILPSFRRVWGNVYCKPPSIFENERLKLFQLSLNIDEFLEYLIVMFKKTKGCLKEFENLDRTPEHLHLIVDNYIGILVKRVLDSEDIKSDIRDVKLGKIV